MPAASVADFILGQPRFALGATQTFFDAVYGLCRLRTWAARCSGWHSTARLRTAQGETFECRYVLPARGCLSGPPSLWRSAATPHFNPARGIVVGLRDGLSVAVHDGHLVVGGLLPLVVASPHALLQQVDPFQHGNGEQSLRAIAHIDLGQRGGRLRKRSAGATVPSRGALRW